MKSCVEVTLSLFARQAQTQTQTQTQTATPVFMYKRTILAFHIGNDDDVLKCFSFSLDKEVVAQIHNGSVHAAICDIISNGYDLYGQTPVEAMLALDEGGERTDKFPGDLLKCQGIQCTCLWKKIQTRVKELYKHGDSSWKRVMDKWVQSGTPLVLYTTETYQEFKARTDAKRREEEERRQHEARLRKRKRDDEDRNKSSLFLPRKARAPVRTGPSTSSTSRSHASIWRKDECDSRQANRYLSNQVGQ